MIILSQFAIGRTALTLYNKSVRCAYGFVCLLHAGCKSADLRAPWDSRCAQLCHEKVADAQSRVARTPVRTGTLRVKARMAYGQDAHGTARAYALRASVHGAHLPAVERTYADRASLRRIWAPHPWASKCEGASTVAWDARAQMCIDECMTNRV